MLTDAGLAGAAAGAAVGVAVPPAAGLVVAEVFPAGGGVEGGVIGLLDVVKSPPIQSLQKSLF